MPDPDLPPIELDDAYIANIKEHLPELPGIWRDSLRVVGIDDAQIEVLVEAEVDDNGVSNRYVIEHFADQPDDARQIVNWIVNIEIPLRAEHDVRLNEVSQRLELYRAIQSLVKENKLSSSNAKQLLTDILLQADLPESIEQLADQKGYIQVSDSEKIEEIVKKVLAANPQAVADVRAGEMKAIGFLVGQVMKESKGQANPGLAQELIRKLV